MRWTARIRHLREAGTQPAGLRSPASAEVPGTHGPTSQAEPGAMPPAAAATTLRDVPDAPEGCRIAVLGAAGSLGSLPAALPHTWSIDFLDEVGDLTVADLVVLASATPGKIAAVRARQPDASIVALACPAARVDAVVELLQSGATACVRSGEADLVAAHLVACARRYSVGAA